MSPIPPDDTLYLIFLAAGMILPAALFWLTNRKCGVTLPRAALLLLCLTLGAVIGGKAVYIAGRVAFLYPMYGFSGLLRAEIGEFTMTGAVLGASAALFLAKYTTLSKAELADRFAPYGALMIALSRFAESFERFGVGSFITEEAHCFYPLALPNDYGGGYVEWYYAVSLLSGAAALILFLLFVKARKCSRGLRFPLVFTFFFTATIITESLRSDCLRWGFVRVQQLVSVLSVCGVTAFYACRVYAVRRKKAGLILPLAVSLACVGLLIGIEFAIDRWIDTPLYLMYIAMLAAVAVMAYTAVRQMTADRAIREENQ